MNLIVFVDKNNGMLFCGKRQTKDKVLLRYVLDNIVKNSRLYITEYTASLFKNIKDNVNIVNNVLTVDDSDCFCIAECVIPEYYDLEKFKTLHVFVWDRAYPATSYLSKLIISKYELDSRETLELSGTHRTVDHYVYTRG